MIGQSSQIKHQDIKFILTNPWVLTDSEWSLDDENIRNNMFSIVMEKLSLAKEDGFSRIWKTEENEPVAILGGFKKAEKKYETFFLASIHMEEYAMKLSFEMRKILKELAPQYKGYRCGLYSASEHPAQLSWFRFLGFTYMPEENIGNSKYFEFSSPAV